MDHHSHRPMRALYWIFLLLLFLPQDSLANHHPTGRFPLQLLKLPSTNLPSISEQTKWPRFGLNSTNKKKKIEKEQDEVTSGETKDDDNSSSSSNKSSSNPSKKPSWKQIRKPEYKSDKKNARFSLPRLFGSRKNQKPKQITSSDRNTNKKVNIPLDTEPKDNKWPPRLRRFRQSNQGKEEGENPNSSSDIQHEYNDDTNDTVLETQPANETEVEVDPQPSSNITEKATTTSTEANATTTSSDDLERSTRQPRQPYPGLVMYGGPPPMYSRPAPMSNRPHVPGMPTNQALAVTAIVSLLSVISRLWIVMWITKRLSSENELIDPVQHFVWECLNDRYTKDQSVLVKALSRPPVGFSRHQWNKFIKRLKEKPTKDAKKTKSKKEIPNKTVVVVDITPNNQLDLQYISDVVNFLTRVHSQNGFGSTVEVVLLLRSPGGPVTTYGLAAAQVARLEEVGMKTTVCVDDVAASGGYMMASQTSQIVAAPFAMVGSIGVMREGMNFNKVLEKYGVRPLIIKAGDMKNPLSALGPVSDKEIKEETKRLAQVHEEFIDLCTTKRPMLNPAICDGTVLTANRAIEFGMVDRVLTSDEYIWERISNGEYVLKLHRTHHQDHTRIFARALDVLPHLKGRLQNVDMGTLIGRVIQGLAFASMLRNKFF